MEKMYTGWELQKMVELALSVARIFTKDSAQWAAQESARNAFEAAKKDPKKMAKILEMVGEESGYYDDLEENDVYNGFEYFLGYYR